VKTLRVRRWCEVCFRFTESVMVVVMGGRQREVCAEHRNPNYDNDR
jgi:hypothetical protein